MPTKFQQNLVCNEVCIYLFQNFLQLHIHTVESIHENYFREAFEEEAFSSINIMRWGEHFDYCITTWLILRHWDA